MPLFLGSQCGSPSVRFPSQGLNWYRQTVCVLIWLCFALFKPWKNVPWLVWCLCFDKRLNCAENHASPEPFLRVTWEAVIQAIVLSLAQIKLFSIPIVDFKHASKVTSVVFDSLWPHGLYVVHQAPLSMGFSRQEYWSELPCPPPGNLPNQIEPKSPALLADSLLLSHQGRSPGASWHSPKIK